MKKTIAKISETKNRLFEKINQINKVKWKLLSHVQLCDPWTEAHRVSLSMEFSSPEYWIGLPFPSPVLTINHNKLKDFCWSLCELTLATQHQGPHVIYFKLSCETSFSGFLMWPCRTGRMVSLCPLEAPSFPLSVPLPTFLPWWQFPSCLINHKKI